MAQSPITKSRVPSTSDAPNGPQQISAAVNDLETFVAMRFDSRADRNARLVGIVPKDGMLCYITDAQVWETYRGGVWTNAPWVPEFQNTALLGATWDGTARLIYRSGTVVLTTGASGAVSFAWGAFPHGIMSMNVRVGDYVTGATAANTTVLVLPQLANMAARSSFNGVALSQNALANTASGQTVRVNYNVWGW